MWSQVQSIRSSTILLKFQLAIVLKKKELFQCLCVYSVASVAWWFRSCTCTVSHYEAGQMLGMTVGINVLLERLHFIMRM